MDAIDVLESGKLLKQYCENEKIRKYENRNRALATNNGSLLTKEDKEYISLLAASIKNEAIGKSFLSKNYECISLLEYYNYLERHDWYSDYSDCSDTRERARENKASLDKIGKHHVKFASLLEEFICWSGKRFNAPNIAPPPRPIENTVIAITDPYVVPKRAKQFAVYCPRGCNVDFVEASSEEEAVSQCASCGSDMFCNCESEYEASIEKYIPTNDNLAGGFNCPHCNTDIGIQDYALFFLEEEKEHKLECPHCDTPLNINSVLLSPNAWAYESSKMVCNGCGSTDIKTESKGGYTSCEEGVVDTNYKCKSCGKDCGSSRHIYDA